MEPYYYQKMNKPQQAAYHAMQQGVLALADEIQLPRIPAEELYVIGIDIIRTPPTSSSCRSICLRKIRSENIRKPCSPGWKSWQDLPQSSHSGKKRSTFTTLSAKISPTIS